MNTEDIIDFHIHLYYDQNTIETAKEVARAAMKEFPLKLGKFHEKNVGPHPRWSVQLTVEKEQYAEVLAWFSRNRKELTIFTHPSTGSDFDDHKNKAIWMGECLEDEIDYSIF